MKRFIAILLCASFLFGCASAPVAMKSRTRYFTPIKTFAQIKRPAPRNYAAFTASSLMKELSEKNTTIELLKRENQKLRDRLAKLEKKLSIVES